MLVLDGFGCVLLHVFCKCLLGVCGAFVLFVFFVWSLMYFCIFVVLFTYIYIFFCICLFVGEIEMRFHSIIVLCMYVIVFHLLFLSGNVERIVLFSCFGCLLLNLILLVGFVSSNSRICFRCCFWCLCLSFCLVFPAFPEGTYGDFLAFLICLFFWVSWGLPGSVVITSKDSQNSLFCALQALAGQKV